jgi:ribosome-binding factor A
MHPYKRSIRVSDLIKEEVADIIMHRLKDPRLEDEKKAESLKILISSARFIRSELAQRVKIKFIPDLVFKLDESIEYSAKINKMLSNIKSSTPPSDNDENLT